MENTEPAKHHLVTVQDIMDAVTLGNIDNFLIDFRNFLLVSANYKNESPGHGLFCQYYIWIDDNLHNEKYTIETQKEEIEIKFSPTCKPQ